MRNFRFEVTDETISKRERLRSLSLEAYCPTCYGSNLDLLAFDPDNDYSCNEYICRDCGCKFRYYVSDFAGFKRRFGWNICLVCLILGLILLVSFVILVDLEVMKECLAWVFMGLIAILVVVMRIFW